MTLFIELHGVSSIASPPSPRWEAKRLPISSAAFLVNVATKIRCGSVPLARSRATRRGSTVVLPLPAPASTRQGPSSCAVACGYCWFNPALRAGKKGIDLGSGTYEITGYSLPH